MALNDLPTGLPADPGVTFDPGRTHVVHGETRAARQSVLCLSRWRIEGPQDQKGEEESPTPPAFRLVALAGEGGFGEVWEAVQTSLGRRVALKRLSRKKAHESSGFGSHSVSHDLFQQEALLTARIEHPGIPPIYDLGLDGDGQPVLAMRFLQGSLWLDLIRKDFSTLDQADFLAKHLPVFVNMLQTVSYAHSRGIVHRDLKPGQVMVGEFGETWLIDWGLAMRFGESVPIDPVERAAWQALPGPLTALNPAGTLAYMAPEQTQKTAAEIGPWTDVYLLGGTLHMLLTGLPPHPAEQTQEVFEQAASGYVIPLAEASRGRDVPRELGSLMSRCLAPSPSDRPESVFAVLQAIKDYLSGTTRRRDSMALVSRLITRLGTSPDDYAVLSDILSETGKARALWAENPAIPELVENTLLSFSRSALGNGDLVLARLHAEHLADPQEREKLLSNVAAEERREKREQTQRKVALVSAFALALALVVSAVFYTRALSNERDQAEAARKQESLARTRSDGLLEFMLKDLRDSLEPVGRLDILEKVLRRALGDIASQPDRSLSDPQRFQKARALDELGHVFVSKGEIDRAEASFEEALAIKRRLLESAPGHLEWTRSVALGLKALAGVEQARGNLDAAGKKFESGLALWRKTGGQGPPGIFESEEAAFLDRLGDVHEARGDLNRALEFDERSLQLLDAAIRQDPSNLNWQRDRAVLAGKLGDVLSLMGRSQQALSQYAAYRDGILSMIEKDPLDVPQLRELAVAHNSLGWALRTLGRLDEALVEIRAQQVIAAKLVSRDASNALWKRDLAQSHAAAGRILKEMGQYGEALSEYRQASAGLAEAAGIDPGNRTSKRDAALCAALTASVLVKMQKWNQARDMLRPAVGTLSAVCAEDPGNAAWLHGLASAEVWLGRALLGSGDRAGARRCLEKAAARLAPLTAELQGVDQRLGSVRAQALVLSGRTVEAKPLVDALLAGGCKDPDLLELLGTSSARSKK